MKKLVVDCGAVDHTEVIAELDKISSEIDTMLQEAHIDLDKQAAFLKTPDGSKRVPEGVDLDELHAADKQKLNAVHAAGKEALRARREKALEGQARFENREKIFDMTPSEILNHQVNWLSPSGNETAAQKDALAAFAPDREALKQKIIRDGFDAVLAEKERILAAVPSPDEVEK